MPNPLTRRDSGTSLDRISGRNLPARLERAVIYGVMFGRGPRK